MPKKSKIGKLAGAATKKEFADELSSYTTLTADEIQALFPKKSDRKELVELLSIVKLSADENTKKAKVIENIGKFSGAVLKIADKFASGL